MKEIVSKRKHNIQKFPITPIMNKNSVFDEKLIAYYRNTYNQFTEIGVNQDKQVQKSSQYLESYIMENLNIAQPKHPLTTNELKDGFFDHWPWQEGSLKLGSVPPFLQHCSWNWLISFF